MSLKTNQIMPPSEKTTGRARPQPNAVVIDQTETPDRVGLSPVQRSILVRQQRMGNAAVVKSLGKTSSPGVFRRSIVQRFEADEHRKLGDTAVPGQTISLSADMSPITYGEMVAMAGDLFESIEQMRQLAQDSFGREQLEYALWKVNPDAHSRPISSTAGQAAQAVETRYQQLAAHNESHFSTGSSAGNTNRERYISGHTSAIQAAFDQGRSRSGISPGISWQAREGFTNHFLTDAFSGGHIRTPRGQIQEHWRALYPNFTQNLIDTISFHMAAYINDVDKIGYVATVSKIADGVRSKLLELAGPTLNAFAIGDLISKVMHDADNAGLNVVSQSGISGAAGPRHWRAVGDNNLFPAAGQTASVAQQDTQQMAEEAVRRSFAEAQNAFQVGQAGGDVAPLLNSASFQAIPLIPMDDTAPTAPATLNPVYNWRVGSIETLPQELKTMIIHLFDPGTEVRQGLDGVAVDEITVKDFGVVSFNLHTGAAWRCFKGLMLADPMGVITRICNGNTHAPGDNNPCH